MSDDHYQSTEHTHVEVLLENLTSQSGSDIQLASPALESGAAFDPNLQDNTRPKTEFSGAVTMNEVPVACKFFFSMRGCSQGNTCQFSHEISVGHNDNDTGLSDSVSGKSTSESQSGSNRKVRSNASTEGTRPICRFYASGYCKWGKRCGFVHSCQTQRPYSSAKGYQEGKLSELVDHQLKALRKTEIAQLKKRFPKRRDVDEYTFRFIFRPSDPDWPFDVKTINIELCFPELYPKHVMTAQVFDEECLPPTLARYICKKMNDWLTDRHEANQIADKAEMVFRFFLRWLDKSAEELFTNGLTMYKRELSAKAAGFTFLHHTELHTPTSASADAVEGDNSGQDVEIEDNSVNDEPLIDTLSTMSLSDRDCKPEVPTNQEKDGQSSTSVTVHQTSGKLNPARRGTELRLRNLQLRESAATLHCTILRIGIKCSRCKTVHHITMHPERPYVVVCDKCRSKMSLVYHSGLMHAASSTVGFFDLDACQPFDLVLQDCQLVAGCLDCSKEILVHGLHAEQEKQFWCIACHKKMTIFAEKGSFILLNDGAAIKIGANAVLIAKKAKARSELRILAEGRQLPDKGACLHYKKSFRWFRFPCCGKLYPCDKCHNEKETDHEMVLANRMICGFCSKEQGFSLTKPCVSCDSSLTRFKSQHWEGGQGCRNKIAMAKGDKQKFLGSNKTISKKAEASSKKSSKKTTHIKQDV